jgi:threonine/homoserine/homoserine lactone efflux protein
VAKAASVGREAYATLLRVIAFWLLFKGLMAGLAIAAPVGPVNVLCASRTLFKGRTSGLVSGLGAASADALYGAVAAFSITLVIDFLRHHEFLIRVVGGLLLIAIGVVYFRKRPEPMTKSAPNHEAHNDFVSTLFLTLTNPTTVLSYIAVLTALGMAGHHSRWLSFLLVAGIFLGSMLWWTILVLIVNSLRDRFNDRVIAGMNRVAGLAIGIFGIITFAVGISHRP